MSEDDLIRLGDAVAVDALVEALEKCRANAKGAWVPSFVIRAIVDAALAPAQPAPDVSNAEIKSLYQKWLLGDLTQGDFEIALKHGGA